MNEINKVFKDIQKEADTVYKSATKYLKKHRKLIVLGITLYVIYKFLFEEENGDK